MKERTVEMVGMILKTRQKIGVEGCTVNVGTIESIWIKDIGTSARKVDQRQQP